MDLAIVVEGWNEKFGRGKACYSLHVISSLKSKSLFTQLVIRLRVAPCLYKNMLLWNSLYNVWVFYLMLIPCLENSILYHLLQEILKVLQNAIRLSIELKTGFLLLNVVYIINAFKVSQVWLFDMVWID